MFAIALAKAGDVSAASLFDGVWRADASTLHATAPRIELELGGGVLSCSSCRPPYTIKADGGFHPLVGQAAADAAAVRVVDPRHMVKTDRFKGRVTLRETFAVAPDGRSAQLTLVDTGLPGAPPKTTQQRLARTAPGSPGANAISGSWALAAVRRGPATETLQVAGDTLKLTTPDGRALSSSLDGRPSPVEGAPGTDAISVRRLSDRVLVETDLLKGRPVMTWRMTVAPDGRTMSVEGKDLVQGTTTTQLARKM